MYSLDKGITLISRKSATQPKLRAEAARRLGELTRLCEQATRIWEGYLANPGPAGDRFALMSWVGSERARELHALNMQARDHVVAIGALAGGAAARVSGLDEDVIEMAYRQLGEDETGAQAAQTAVARLKQRIAYLQKLITQLATASAAAPAKAPVKKAAPRGAGKKPAAKRKAAKASKKAAARKPAAAKKKARGRR